MELITKLTNELDTEIARVWSEYINLHEELNKHRGKPIDESNMEEVNRLLKAIQETFNGLYPAFHFITARHEYASNAVNGFNEFIDMLKKSGAHQDESKPEQPAAS